MCHLLTDEFYVYCDKSIQFLHRSCIQLWTTGKEKWHWPILAVTKEQRWNAVPDNYYIVYHSPPPHLFWGGYRENGGRGGEFLEEHICAFKCSFTFYFFHITNLWFAPEGLSVPWIKYMANSYISENSGVWTLHLYNKYLQYLLSSLFLFLWILVFSLGFLNISSIFSEIFGLSFFELYTVLWNSTVIMRVKSLR